MGDEEGLCESITNVQYKVEQAGAKVLKKISNTNTRLV
jgi:hypothetical protein